MNDFSASRNVGPALGHLRLRRNLSQVALEKRSGINHSDFAAYESGTKPMPRRTVKRLLAALGYDAATLAATVHWLDTLDARERTEPSPDGPPEIAEAHPLAAFDQEIRSWLREAIPEEGLPPAVRRLAKSPEDRAATEELWQELQAYPLEIWKHLFLWAPEIPVGPIVERLCRAALDRAADQDGAALKMAETAVDLARFERGDESRRGRTRDYAEHHLESVRALSSAERP